MFKRHINATAGVLAGLFLFFSANLQAQDKTPCDYSIPGEVLNWNFGDKAQLTFSEESLFPVSTAMPGGIDIPKGVSSISDAEGNLLFFSNGMRLWGSGFFEIINGTDLYGSLGATQSAIFIPAPNNVNKYFIFTADFYYPDIPQYNNHGIRYSVIEKTNYQWEVTDEKNQLILSENAQKLTAVKHANGQDYWLLTHGFGVNNGGKYFAYLITENGIDPNNVVTSNVGYFHDGTSSDNNNAGYMKISIDGKKIALVIPSENGVIEVADFNSATGEVSNAINNEGTFFNMPLGIEFSPNSKLLYVSTNPKPQSQGDKNSYILQFNLDQLDFSSYHILEELSINDNGRFGALQLGPDGRIYAARGGVSLSPFEKLGIIYNPNRFGTACNYNHIDGAPSDGLELADETGSIEGLPNFVSSYFDIPSFWWQNHCATHITTFRLQNEANNGDVTWDFGIDGATDVHQRGQYTYEEAGTYPVTVTEEFEGETYTHTRDITIYPLPTIDIGTGEDIIYILPNSSITLDAGEFDQYSWEDEDGNLLGEGQYLDVDQEGIYAVTVTDINCCENRDEVEIKFANISLPNAFRPGSAIPENKTFQALGAVSALNNFKLIIYNRWGQLVFESDDPLQGWDGTIKGEAAPEAVYVWQMTYESSESQYQASQEVVQRGVVTLVR
jgi:gliding motility-associated-like protein